MAASTSQVAHPTQSDSSSFSTGTSTPGAEADDIQGTYDSENFVSFSVLCLHDFSSEDAGLLSFRKNEILDIIKRDESGWWAAIQQDGPDGPLVGWIPQAYVSVLSEEMTIKLRSKEGFSGKGDYLEYASHTASVDGCSSSFTTVEDRFPFQQYAFPSGHSSTDKLSYRYEDESVKRHSSDSDGTSRSYLTSSSVPSIPLPPSRSASFKKNWKPQTSFPDGTRPRAGSLTPSRSARRPHMHSNDSSRSSNVEANKSRELTKKSSSTFTGTIESLYKRIGDDKTQGREANEDASGQHIGPPCSRIVTKYELDEDDTGHVRSGTLPALIERLTLELPTDPTKRSETNTFCHIFLMTFRTFTTPDAFFDMLLERYHTPPPNDLSETANAEWTAHIRFPLRLRVLEIFAAWLEDHRLLEEEPYIVGRLTEFLGSVDDPSLTSAADSLLKAIQRLTFNAPSKLATTASPKKARKSKAYKNELTKMDPVDIAEQLTLLEFGLYVKITPQECLAYAKAQSGATVANLVEFCSTHDKLASWVKSSVLNNDALGKRVDTVGFWIKVAEKCLLLNNFSSMAAIVTAVSATVLTQLHMTWGNVSRKSNLEALLRYNKPTGGFSGYRSLLQQVEGSCVPFITMYLTDIIHANQRSKEQSDVIDFFQRARWHEVITQMLKFQQRPYKIAPSETTTQFIDANLREALWDDNWFWQRSQEIQQTEAEDADIRKGLEAAGF